MELHLKKRILGALVTVGIAALVLPLVLDGSRTHRGLSSDIPPMPEPPQWSTLENERQIRKELEQLASGKAAEMVSVADIAIVDRDELSRGGVQSDRSSLDDEQMPYAWTLQIGVFSQRDNAHRLRDKLRGLGYKAYVQEFAATKHTGVYVGPELTRAKAEELQAALKAKLKQKDIYLRRYKAES
jgi:DedD protein